LLTWRAAGEGYPCERPSQKQYEYLKGYGKITDNIEDLKPGDILFFKECEKDQDCPIVHVIFMEDKAKEKDQSGIDKELSCTQEACSINTISTSAGVPIMEKRDFCLRTDVTIGVVKAIKYLIKIVKNLFVSIKMLY
jgi:hypothetical protein